MSTIQSLKDKMHVKNAEDAVTPKDAENAESKTELMQATPATESHSVGETVRDRLGNDHILAKFRREGFVQIQSTNVSPVFHMENGQVLLGVLEKNLKTLPDRLRAFATGNTVLRYPLQIQFVTYEGEQFMELLPITATKEYVVIEKGARTLVSVPDDDMIDSYVLKATFFYGHDVPAYHEELRRVHEAEKLAAALKKAKKDVENAAKEEKEEKAATADKAEAPSNAF